MGRPNHIGPRDPRAAAWDRRSLAARGPRFIRFTLPVYWASYLANGDATGIDRDDRRECDRFMALERLRGCVGVSDTTDEYAPSNDANGIAGAVAEYTFPRKRLPHPQPERFPLPSIASLTETLLDIWVAAYVTGEPNNDDDSETRDNADEYCDVRLQTFGSERSAFGYRDCWHVTTGDSSYDQAHGDACSSSSLDLTEKPTKKTARTIAREMLGEIRDQIATNRRG